MSRLGEKLNQLKGRGVRSSSPALSGASAAASSSPSGGGGVGVSSSSFKFSKADEAIVEILETADAILNNSSSKAPGSSRYPEECEPRPIKEAILTRFAKLAPSHEPAEDSWLNSVKGRIAKTVEEKCRDMRKGGAAGGGEDPLTRSESEDLLQFDNEPPEPPPLPHSFSAGTFDDDRHRSLDPTPSKRDSDKSGGDGDDDDDQELEAGGEVSFKKRISFPTIHPLKKRECDPATPTPSEPNKDEGRSRRFRFHFHSLRKPGGSVDDATPTPTPEENGYDEEGGSSFSSPSRVRRKFNLPSFNSLKSRKDFNGAEAVGGGGGGGGEDAAEEPSSLPPIDTATPRSSLRSRLMNYMAKTPPASLLPEASVSMKELSGSFEDLETKEDIEEAVEVDETFTYEAFGQRPVVVGDEEDNGSSAADVVEERPRTAREGSFGYWWAAALPVCLLLLLQILPFPSWVVGFVTGIAIAVPATGYVAWHLKDGSSKATPFVENVARKVAKKPAIIVQEELERKFAWMNLWPAKKGPYDPLTYDVRRTSSARVMVHGPWIEMRFPKRNLPLRRMHDDAAADEEGRRIDFHDRVEVVDLSTCSVDLLPENLPTKRLWSKKYPIRIRTNCRKAAAANRDDRIRRNLSAEFKDCCDGSKGVEEEQEEQEQEDLPDRRRRSEEDDEQPFDDAVEQFVVVPDEESANRSFYLFARTGREKEEWYNRFVVAARFMQDWEQQNPKPGEFVDENAETQKVKEQKFKLFMEDYLQAKNEEQAKSSREEMVSKAELRQCAKDQMAFLNVYFARMWHDLHDSKIFLDFLREKITRKLMKVKFAQFFEEVSVTTLDLGPKLPQITSTSLPWQDELGLWVNLEVEYSGICQATVETQGIRLPGKDEPDREAQELARILGRQAAAMDSDEEDSAEEDDEAVPETACDVDDAACDLQPHAGFRARMLDSLLKSDFVAKVAESEWVKKNITNKNITLQLQLHVLEGTFTMNFPPAPSDRIWYGFRYPPRLDIALRPCFGGHTLGKYEGTLSTVMKHLEKRLKQEFMKVLVYPNLDDEVLPFLSHVPYSFGTVEASGSPTKETKSTLSNTTVT